VGAGELTAALVIHELQARRAGGWRHREVQVFIDAYDPTAPALPTSSSRSCAAFARSRALPPSAPVRTQVQASLQPRPYQQLRSLCRWVIRHRAHLDRHRWCRAVDAAVREKGHRHAEQLADEPQLRPANLDGQDPASWCCC